MSEINDGGPAFPVSTQAAHNEESGPYGHQDSASTWQFPGMTLRDYFAIRALPLAWRAQLAELRHYDDTATDRDVSVEGAARRAYSMADAMLEARTEAPQPKYRELYPSEQEKLATAEKLANTVEALQKEPVWPMLPEALRIAARDAASDVLEPPLPF